MEQSNDENLLKYENYREQSKRLSRALRSEFYFEAILIEYAIIEDRITSALTHANAFSPKQQKTLNTKLNKLEKLCEKSGGIAKRYFAPKLIEQLRAWKDRRNTLVHELMRTNLEPGDLEGVAREGKELVKAIKSKVGSFNRAVDKAGGKN